MENLVELEERPGSDGRLPSRLVDECTRFGSRALLPLK
jgi:hypothetical protein